MILSMLLTLIDSILMLSTPFHYAIFAMPPFTLISIRRHPLLSIYALSILLMPALSPSMPLQIASFQPDIS
jgi:hypothetical protein